MPSVVFLSKPGAKINDANHAKQTRHPKHWTETLGRTMAMVGADQVPANLSLFGFVCMARIFQTHWKTFLLGSDMLASRQEDGKRLRSGSSSQTVQRSSEPLCSPSLEAVLPLGCHLRFVARHVLDGWTSVEDLLLRLAREVLTVDSLPVPGRTLTDLLPIHCRPAVNVEEPVKRGSQGVRLSMRPASSDLSVLSVVTGLTL